MHSSSSATGPDTARPTQSATTRFRCGCGRSVAATPGSEAATTGRCSSCRARERTEAPLHRTT